MPAPTGVTLIINTGDAATNDPDVSLAITATGADEMAFSNNGVDFSPFEAFATTKSWSLFDFDGGFQEGTRLVTVKVRDTLDNAETKAVDTIIFEVPAPRIEYDAQVPSQRTGTRLLDIDYVGLEDSPANADNVTILDAEIDLSGAFAGAEIPLLEAVDDSLTEGRIGLMFSNSGEDHKFVADLEKTFASSEPTSSVARIRLRAQFGSKIGEFAVSGQFPVNLRSELVDEATGRKTTFEVEIFLVGIFRNALFDLQDTDALPKVTEIIDPDGGNALGSPTDATRVSPGVYRFPFTPTITDVPGQWSYTYEGDIDGITVTKKGFFQVVTPPQFVAPEKDGTCIVFGDLVMVDGTALSDTEILVFAHHLSEPEFKNPTSIGTRGSKTRTDSVGHFEIELVRNAEVVVTIDALSYRQFGRVPDQEIAEYKNIQLVLPTGVRDNFGNPV